MASVKRDQEIRAEFYASKSLAKYINVNNIPKTNRAFREMVASSSSEDLESEKGLELITCLGEVTFLRHAQQINIMDKSNGKIIATIER